MAALKARGTGPGYRSITLVAGRTRRAEGAIPATVAETPTPFPSGS